MAVQLDRGAGAFVTRAAVPPGGLDGWTGRWLIGSEMIGQKAGRSLASCSMLTEKRVCVSKHANAIMARVSRNRSG